jgi:hypothetical protein
MAEILEDHIRLFICMPDRGGASTNELMEDLMNLAGAHLR